MTPERASEVWKKRGPFCELPFAFVQKSSIPDAPTHPDGITRDEDQFIRKHWATMKGGFACYMSAFHEIRKGGAS